MKVSIYQVTVKPDDFHVFKIETSGTSARVAIQKVINMENCPDSAILSCKKIKELV